MKKPTAVSCNIIDNDKCMSIDKLKFILDNFITLDNIRIYGFKDPLLNQDIFDILHECTNRNINTTLYTSGFLFNKDNVSKLPKSHLTIVIKINSIEPDSFYEYNKIEIDKLYTILSLLSKQRKNVKIVLQPIFSRESIGTIDRIIPVANRYKAELEPVYPTAYTQKQCGELHPFELYNLQAKMEHFNIICNHFGVPLKLKASIPTPMNCYEAYRCPTVNSNGEVYPCSYIYNNLNSSWDEFYFDNKITLPQHTYLMGNIFELNINKMFKNKNYKKLRNVLAESRSIEKARLLTRDQYKILRSTTNVNEKFAYCRICLHRWQQV